MSSLTRLFWSADHVMKNAYNPYSDHSVGVAIRTPAGAIHTGCNVENSSFGVTMCAERNAIGSLVACGHRKIQSIVVVNSKEEPAWPCGMCRQALAEFGDMEVWTNGPDGREMLMLSDLLPKRFEL